MHALVSLPDEILLHLVKELSIPFDYSGYYWDPFFPPREEFSGPRNGQSYHLRDALALSATCKNLRSKLGPMVWGDFVLNEKTFRSHSERNDYFHVCIGEEEPNFIDALAASLVETEKGRYVKSDILEFVSIFEPQMSTAKLSKVMRELDMYQSIQLVNKWTLPSLQRLIIDFQNYQDEIYGDLVVRLQDYDRPVKISTRMTSTSNLQILQESFWSMVDHLHFTITSRSNQARDFTSLETRVKSLKSLTLWSSLPNKNDCAQLVRHLAAMINNNGDNLETLNLYHLALSFSEIDGSPLLELPMLKQLQCHEKHLSSFSRRPKLWRLLELLDVKFDAASILANINIPLQLTSLSCLDIIQLPDKTNPENYLPFFSRLQDANPSLNSINFSCFTIPEVLALAPVLSQFKHFKIRIMEYCDTYAWPKMATVSTSLEAEIEHMHVNRILNTLILNKSTDTGKLFSFPASPHELISYPLLKAIALDSRYPEPQVSNLDIYTTWPRVTESLTDAQLSLRAQCFRTNYQSPHVAFEVYEPIGFKPIGEGEDQSYLQDLFYGFNDGESFKITDFCFLVRDMGSLWKPSSQEGTGGKVKFLSYGDNPRWNQVEMHVKIDLKRLRKLLSP